MYKLIIAPIARKPFRNIKKLYQEAIDAILQEIKEDPALGKPLSRELTGRFTFHIGSYRIIYKVNEKDKTINILKIDHRSRVYG